MHWYARSSPHEPATTLTLLRAEVQVPGNPKTDIIVAVVRPVVIAVGGPAILWIVVPGTAAQNKGTDSPTVGEGTKIYLVSGNDFIQPPIIRPISSMRSEKSLYLMEL